jgi:hypothetical protein
VLSLGLKVAVKVIDVQINGNSSKIGLELVDVLND